MTTRAKFVCNSVTNYGHGKEDINQSVSLNADASEHSDFTRFTPCGKLEMGITNPALKDFFVPGEKYSLDISKA